MRICPKADRAFTIVELLIAAAITVLIVVMLGTMIGSLAKTTSHANQRIDSFRDARAALQMMERDFSALVHATPAGYFEATTDSTIYSDPNKATVKNYQLYALCALKNKASANPNAATGDMCSVGYYCRWDTDANGQEGRYVLHRYFRDSVATFQAFQKNGGGTYMSPTSLYLPSASDDVLASYVWNLQVTAFKTDGSVDTTNPLLVGDPATPNVTLPAAIEISFNVTSPQSARAMISVSSNADDWMNPSSQNYQHLLAPNTYGFRTRISL